jgi:hypothetical protein
MSEKDACPLKTRLNIFGQATLSGAGQILSLPLPQKTRETKSLLSNKGFLLEYFIFLR